MKKFLAFFICMILILPLAAAIVSAGPNGQSYGQVKWMDINQIEINGEKKPDLLANALLIEVKDIALPGYERDNHATGKFWYLWNEAGIYVFAEVKDPTPTVIPPLPPAVLSADPATHAWNRDNLEVFIVPNNGSEAADAFAYSVSPNNEAYVFSFSFVEEENMGAPHEQGTKLRGAEKPYIDFVAKYDPSDNTVYYAEMFFKVPDYKYQAGQKVGTMIAIDDMDKAVGDFTNAGDRAIYSTMSESAGNVWAIADHWYIELSAESAMPPPPPEPEPEPAATPEGGPEPDAPAPAPSRPASPQTGDAGAVIFIFAFAGLAAGLAVILKNKKTAR